MQGLSCAPVASQTWWTAGVLACVTGLLTGLYHIHRVVHHGHRVSVITSGWFDLNRLINGFYRMAALSSWLNPPT